MELQDFIQALSGIKGELQTKEVKVIAPNGLMLSPKIKFVLKDKYNPANLNAENVENIIITFE